MTGTWASGWATGDIVTAAEFKKSAGSIFDSTLGGSAANIDVTGIVATYAHLLVTLYLRGDNASAFTSALLRFNNDSGANYDIQTIQGVAAVASAVESFAATSLQFGIMPANTATANYFGCYEIFIPHYAGTTNNKSTISLSSNRTGTASTTFQTTLFGGGWRSNAAINRITVFPTAGNLVTGSRLTIHALGA